MSDPFTFTPTEDGGDDGGSSESLSIPQELIYAGYALAGAIGLIAISMLILVIMFGTLLGKFKSGPPSASTQIASR